MSLDTLATIGCLLGAAGAGLVLVPRSRVPLALGFGLLTVAEVLLAWSLVPRADLEQLTGSGVRIGLLVVAAAVLLGGGVLLSRVPAAVPLALLLVAAFRIPVELGAQEAFLLVPLYAVLAASVIGLLVRLFHGEEPPALPRALSLPATAFIALSGVSLLWSDDVRAGTILLLFFLFPFAAMAAVVARSPLAGWLSRALTTTLVALGCAFGAIGLSQLWTGDVYFARDLEVANAYTTQLRTASLFADPSIYGRQLGLAIVVLVAAVYLARVRLLLAGVLIAFLWTALFFSYSQSTMVALVAAVLAVGLLAADRANRRLLLAATLVVVIAGGIAAGLAARGDSAQRITSGRSGLVSSTWRVFVAHPLVGVGVGAQPQAAREEGGKRTAARNASHTTPLTVAAELGVLGVVVYLALLVGAARLLRGALARDPALGLGLIGGFVLLLVHSLFYSGFFEDALTWGILALAAAVSVAGPPSEPRPGLLPPGVHTSSAGGRPGLRRRG